MDGSRDIGVTSAFSSEGSLDCAITEVGSSEDLGVLAKNHKSILIDGATVRLRIKNKG